MKDQNSKVTLLEWWNELGGCEEAKHVFVVSTAEPGGHTYTNNIETEIDEDYCDLNELFDNLGSDPWELTGTVTEDGGWEWDGSDDFRDWNANSYQSLKVY